MVGVDAFVFAQELADRGRLSRRKPRRGGAEYLAFEATVIQAIARAYEVPLETLMRRATLRNRGERW